MKKFHFPLARVMDFRRMQARMEETRLEVQYSELRAIDTREAALMQEKEQAERALKSAPSVTGFDLQVFDTYLQGLKAEQKRMDNSRADCRQRFDAQRAVLTAKCRDVKLLEHLKKKWSCGAGWQPAADW